MSVDKINSINNEGSRNLIGNPFSGNKGGSGNQEGSGNKEGSKNQEGSGNQEGSIFHLIQYII